LELHTLASDEFAINATHAMYCATEQGKGFTAHNELFLGYLKQGYDVAYSRAGINALLEPLGLDMDQFNACIDDEKYSDALDAVRQDFYDTGLTGTPTVTLAMGDDDPAPMTLPDGQIWSGAIPLQFLRQVFTAAENGVPFADYFTQ
jgi:predicted DsbA family dithiol-disulfide isomerase